MPIWIIISFLVLSALCIFSAVKLFSNNRKAYAKAALGAYIFYAAVYLAIWIFRIDVPPYLLLLTMLTVLGSSFFGHYLECYTKSRTFDRYLHGFGTFSFALLTYCVMDDFITTGGSMLFRAVFIFFAGNTVGVLFELFEMLHDVTNKTEPKSQKGLRDTDMDMCFNLIGSVLAGVFAYFWLLP